MKGWIYITDKENKSRFALGIKGEKPLVCFGMNPSTAYPEDLDPTIRTVQRLVDRKGYDGWIMLNLYPQRDPDPNKLAENKEEWIFIQNLQVIGKILFDSKPTIWAAWGTLIKKRPFLFESLREVYIQSKLASCNWVSYGTLTKDGHPHHPLYQSTSLDFIKFDIKDYLIQNIEIKDIKEELMPIYREGNKILIALAENIPQGVEKIHDCLIMKIDIEAGVMEGIPWSGQKMLKFGSYTHIESNEKSEMLKKLVEKFDIIEMNKLYRLLKKPPQESIDTLTYSRNTKNHEKIIA